MSTNKKKFGELQDKLVIVINDEGHLFKPGEILKVVLDIPGEKTLKVARIVDNRYGLQQTVNRDKLEYFEVNAKEVK